MTEPAASSAPDRWITLANALTATRLVLIPVSVHAIRAGAAEVVFAVFWLAVLTDMLDGRVARRRGEASRLGGILDHSTDALFVSAGLAAYASLGVVPVLLAPLVLLAFVQYALDSRVLAGERLRASQIGRWNGILYFVLMGVPVVRDALSLGWPPAGVVTGLGWVLVLSTVVSMADRALAFSRKALGSRDEGR